MPNNFIQIFPVVDEFYVGFGHILEVSPSTYINAIEEGWKLDLCPKEIKDSDLLKLVEKSEAFSFLNKESEDIYSLKDGTSIDER